MSFHPEGVDVYFGPKNVTVAAEKSTGPAAPVARSSNKPRLTKTETEKDLTHKRQNAFQQNLSAVAPVKLPAAKSPASTSTKIPKSNPKGKNKKNSEMRCTVVTDDGRDPIAVNIPLPEDAGVPVVVKIPTLTCHYTVVITKGGVRNESVATFGSTPHSGQLTGNDKKREDWIDDRFEVSESSEELLETKVNGAMYGSDPRYAEEEEEREEEKEESMDTRLLSAAAVSYVANNKGKPSRDIRTALHSQGLTFTKRDLNAILHRRCTYHRCEGYTYWYPREK
jgi:hypothetical protein